MMGIPMIEETPAQVAARQCAEIAMAECRRLYKNAADWEEQQYEVPPNPEMAAGYRERGDACRRVAEKICRAFRILAFNFKETE